MGKYNYVFSGKVIPIQAPRKVESGEGLIVGDLFGVVVNAAENGQPTELHLSEVFRLPKAKVAISVGSKLYWDDENKCVTNIAGELKLVGAAIQAALELQPVIEVRLNGVTI